MSPQKISTVRKQISELDLNVSATNLPDVALMDSVAEILINPKDKEDFSCTTYIRKVNKQN